jgi:hypothetical protein
MPTTRPTLAAPGARPNHPTARHRARYLPLFLALALLLAPACAGPARAQAAGAPDAAEVDRATRAAVAEVAKAQERADRWAEEKPGLEAEARELKAREAWLEFQVRRHEGYVAERRRRVAELERRKAEAARLGQELEPLLEAVLARLEAFVAADLPFLAQERRARLAFLRESLDDCRLGLGEKLRRVLEALQVEADYGRGVEAGTVELPLNSATAKGGAVATDGAIPTDGAASAGEARGAAAANAATGPTVRVATYRLGRLGYFYLAADPDAGVGAAGRWDPAARAWRRLDGDAGTDLARTLRQAIDMAERRRAADFLEFPLPGPGPGPEDAPAPPQSGPIESGPAISGLTESRPTESRVTESGPTDSGPTGPQAAAGPPPSGPTTAASGAHGNGAASAATTATAKGAAQ